MVGGGRWIENYGTVSSDDDRFVEWSPSIDDDSYAPLHFHGGGARRCVVSRWILGSLLSQSGSDVFSMCGKCGKRTSTVELILFPASGGIAQCLIFRERNMARSR